MILDLVARLRGGGPGLDHHDRAQLRPRPAVLRPGQPDPGRRDHVRQARRPRRRSRSSTRSWSRSTGARGWPPTAPSGGAERWPTRASSASTSARSPGARVVVRASDGAELGSAVHEYPHAVIERELPASGERLPPQWALQDPEDYVEVLRAGGARRRRGGGRRARATSSASRPTSPPARRCRCCADGTPLCRVAGFRGPPARVPEAVEAPRRPGARPTASTRSPTSAASRGWRATAGGSPPSGSSPRRCRCSRRTRRSTTRMDRWIEGADWIVWQLCGAETRNACTAGYKGILQDGRYPSRGLPARARRALRRLRRRPSSRRRCSPLGARAGGLTAAGGRRGPGCPRASPSRSATSTRTSPRRPRRRVEPGQMLAVMGTSTCHIMNGDDARRGARACAASCDGGIVPGLWGYEAGQSGVGDIFALVRRATRAAALPRRGARSAASTCTTHLSELAGEQEVGEHGLVALDWHNGNRSVLVDHELSGLIVGLTLATRAEDVYRALIEATAFGTRTILEAFARRRRAGERAVRRRRADQEPGDHADLRRRRRGCRCT